MCLQQKMVFSQGDSGIVGLYWLNSAKEKNTLLLIKMEIMHGASLILLWHWKNCEMFCKRTVQQTAPFTQFLVVGNI